MLALKLLLVPALLAVVTLAGRRWGQRVAGWLGSFPIVAGPILLILTLENGVSFGAAAAERALAAVAATMGFFVLYARLAPRLSWPVTALVCTVCWLVLVAWLGVLPQTLTAAAAVALVALLLAPRAMGADAPPRTVDAPAASTAPAYGELAARTSGRRRAAMHRCSRSSAVPQPCSTMRGRARALRSISCAAPIAACGRSRCSAAC
jgi:hypothetical protein